MSKLQPLILISDDALLAARLSEMLFAARFVLHVAHDIAAAEKIKTELPVKAILLDVSAKNTIETFSSKPSSLNSNPWIVIYSQVQEIEGSRAVRLGASDCLIREHLTSPLLEHSILSAIAYHEVKQDFEKKVQQFKSNEARLLNVIVHSVDGIVVVARNGAICFQNPVAQRQYGRMFAALLAEGPISCYTDAVLDRQDEGPDGVTQCVEVRVSQILWDSSDAWLVSIHDVTNRKMAVMALQESEERYALAIEGSKEGLWDWELRTDTIFFSTRWKEMIGFTETDIDSKPSEWLSRIQDEDRTSMEQAIRELISGQTQNIDREYQMVHKDGSVRWMHCRGTAVRDPSGTAVRLVGSQSDITERKTAEHHLKKALDDLRFALASERVLIDELDKKNKELVELSITDGLTGLFNHRFIQERFDFEFKRVKRYGGFLSCMIIDIDHFKNINDTYGHQIGDFVLRELGSIIKNLSREVDICGRYGGEEFMTLSNVPLDDALKYANKLHAAIEKKVFEIKGNSIKVTVSIGLTEFRTDMRTKQQMIDYADQAMYQAKQDGRNLIRIWKEQSEQAETSLDKFSIDELKQRFLNLSKQMRDVYMESTEALVRAIDAKDHYTREHSQNVSIYSVAMAQALGMTDEEIQIIRYAALLHDVGKIGISTDVLIKVNALTPEEFEILKKHPIIGVNILKDVKFLEKEIPIIMHHHERYDGNGYPHGLKGREIPVGARILGVADAFDAMTTDRGYKMKMPREKAVDELVRGKGAQFSPEVVDAFIELLQREFPET